MVEDQNQYDIFSQLQNNNVNVSQQEADKLEELSNDESLLEDFMFSVSKYVQTLDTEGQYKFKPKDPEPVQEKPKQVLNPQEENLEPLQSRFATGPSSPSINIPSLNPPTPQENYTEEFKDVDLSPIRSRFEKTKPTSNPINNTLPSKADIASQLDEKLSSQSFSDSIDSDSDLICPVDIDTDESGKQSLFFNLNKTLKFYDLNFLADKISIDNSKFETPGFQRLAMNLYKKYEAKKKLSFEVRQKQRKNKKLLAIIIPSSAVVILILTIFLTSLPKSNLKKGVSYIKSEQYGQAEKTLCSKIVNNAPYCVLAKAYNKTTVAEFSEAYDYLDKLEDYQSQLAINLPDARNEIKYLESKYLLENKQYNDALKVLAEIPNYKDVADIYATTCYDLASTLSSKIDAKSKLASLSYFYMAKDYNDASEKYSTIADELYSSATTLYLAKSYDSAQEIFSTLAKHNYKDAELMSYQCSYSQGLDAYKSGNFASSNEIFSQIKFFKDSSALLKSDQEISNINSAAEEQ